MTDFLQFAVLGLGTGAVLAVMAQGIIVIHRGTGVLNLAHGVEAMLGAYLYYHLSRTVEMADHLAIALSILCVCLVGGLIHLVVMRPLAGASPLVRVVATLASVMVIQSGVVLYFGSERKVVLPYLPNDVHTIGGVGIPLDRIVMMAVALALALGLGLSFHRTTLGLGVLAAAENPRAAAALGWSTNAIAALAWSLGSGLAALAGILVVPLSGLDSAGMTDVLIGGLAAALVARFSSLWLATAGGLAIGMAQSILPQYISQQGVPEIVPFAVIVVVLVLRGAQLPGKSHGRLKLPELGPKAISSRRVAGWLVAATALVYALPVSWTNGLRISLIAALFILSVVVLTGYAGQLSLGQYALGGIAAYVSGRLVAATGAPFELAFVLGVLAAVVFGLLFALPALRTRGVDLAVVTLGLGLAIQKVVFENADYTGGISGTSVGRTRILGIEVDALSEPRRYAMVALLALAVCGLGVSNLRRSPAGRRLVAVRANERAAAALGVNVTSAKLYAFGVSAAVAGVAGILMAFANRVIVYEFIGPLQSISVVTLGVLGGVGYVSSGVLGGQFWSGGIGASFGRLLGIDDLGQWLILGTGVVVILLLVQDPNGMASHMRHTGERVLALLRSTFRRSGGSQPPGPEDPGLPRPPVVADGERSEPVRPAALDVTDVSVRFGGVQALANVSLSVAPGEIVGVIGPNGSGKTTLIDAISGFVTPQQGSVRLGELELTGLPAFARTRFGLSRSFQSLELFDDVSVLENLQVAADDGRSLEYLRSLVAPGEQPLRGAAADAVEMFRLQDALGTRPADLPFGTRRLVAIARAMAARPSILLLDEPAAGLSHSESMELARLIKHVAQERGIGVMVVEHDMSFIMSLCDRVTVLNFGEVIAAGDPDEVRRDPAVVAAYLGSASSRSHELA
jgi:ABC-type branched-subunit amino acid transport system ATPase component/branched-subunit amino acid ABC-type transport system permease component